MQSAPWEQPGPTWVLFSCAVLNRQTLTRRLKQRPLQRRFLQFPSNGKVRDELLDREVFETLLETRVLMERWRQKYNTVQPHSSLGYRPPAPDAWLSLDDHQTCTQCLRGRENERGSYHLESGVINGGGQWLPRLLAPMT